MSRKKPWWIHLLGTFVALVTLLFSYAALMQDGIAHAVAGFLFGFAFLLLIYGHQFDRIYIHIGERFKFGADAYDPDHDTIHIEHDDKSNFEELE